MLQGVASYSGSGIVLGVVRHRPSHRYDRVGADIPSFLKYVALRLGAVMAGDHPSIIYLFFFLFLFCPCVL